MIGGGLIVILLIVSFCVWFCRKRDERKIKMLEVRKQELDDEYGNQQIEMENGLTPLQALFENKKPLPKMVNIEPF